MNKNSALAQDICNISFCETRFVNAIIPGSDKNHKIVVFDQECGWTKLYFSMDDTNFDESGKDSTAGNIFNQELKVKFPGINPDNREFFANTNIKRLVIRIEYQNGMALLFGDKDNPVRMQVSSNNKKNASIITFSRLGNKCFWLEE